MSSPCLLYTSDAADDLTRVDLGGRRIIKQKKILNNRRDHIHHATMGEMVYGCRPSTIRWRLISLFERPEEGSNSQRLPVRDNCEFQIAVQPNLGILR